MERMAPRESVRIALHRLEALADTEPHADGFGHSQINRCAIPIAHREAVKLYLQTWVLPQLRQALAKLERRDRKKATR